MQVVNVNIPHCVSLVHSHTVAAIALHQRCSEGL